MPRPHIVLAGGGAAGLWCALALLDRGWSGDLLTVVDPDPKVADDHTWGYWALTPLLPVGDHVSVTERVVLREGGREVVAPTAPYRYYCLRSSTFYAFAKTRLHEAGVAWRRDGVTGFGVRPDGVDVYLAGGDALACGYALDSRPPDLAALDAAHNTTLQHFGGYYVRADRDCFATDRVVLMDFVPAGPREVAFFYVVPSSARGALVELAVLSTEPWPRGRYDGALDDYLAERYGGASHEVVEREYGVIPMSDAPLWRASTPRVWAVGTRGGWVQPSSGYAFTRIARFARETAGLLAGDTPRPWRPSALQQVLNATMLRYVNERPGEAGRVFVDLFVRNGAPRAFAFLDEGASAAQTLRLMWNSPRAAFADLAAREALARIFRRRA